MWKYWIGLGWETYFTQKIQRVDLLQVAYVCRLTFLIKFESRSRESPNLAGDAGDTFLFSMDVSLYLYYFVILYQKIVLISHSDLDFHRRYYLEPQTLR